ncbi:MAG: T9SS type A sorting domain-containing protein [Salibacteraceae bacterium]
MKNWQPKYFLVLIAAFSVFSIEAATYVTKSNGNYNAASNWVGNNKPGNWWGAGDTVIVEHAITLSSSLNFAGVLIIESSGSLTGTSKNIELNNGAKAFFDGAIDIKNLSSNSTSIITATAPIEAQDLSIQNGSSFSTTNTIELSDDFTNNGGSFNSTSSLTVGDDFALNNSGTFSISGNVSVNDDIELNSGTTATFGSSISIGDDITVNGGTATFNGPSSFGGDAEFNSGSNVNINNTFESAGDVTLNGATVNVAASGKVSAGDDIKINGVANLTNAGTISADDDLNFNGGTVSNTGKLSVGDDMNQNGGTTFNNNFPGRIETGDDYTHNGGVLNNNYHMVVGDKLTVNGGATHSGNGKLQVEVVQNNGAINGNLDICSIDGNVPTFLGGGSYGGSITYCDDPSIYALPIQLISFEAKLENNDAIITWETASELNNDYFLLKKSTDGGKTFSDVAKVYGMGTTNESQQYSFVDDLLNNDGGVYYQLVQVDFNGIKTDFEVIYLENQKKVNNSAQAEILVYPNPFVDEIQFKSTSSLMMVSLLSIDGVVISEWEFNAVEKQEEIRLTVPESIESGLYLLLIESNGETQVSKIYKK